MKAVSTVGTVRTVRTIRQQLLMGLLWSMVLAIGAAGITTYLKMRHETNELFDYQLKQIVRSFPDNMTLQKSETVDTHPGKKIVVQVWNSERDMVFTSNPNKNLPRYESRGYFDVDANGGRWRVYSEENHRQIVQVGQLIRDREKIEFSLALRSQIPFFSLIPVLGVLIWLVVGKSLQPLSRLKSSLDERSAESLAEMDTEGYPPEVKPIVLAINELFSRLDRAMQSQKMFVADAAHELRTPLTALKLQLQLVEKAESDAERNASVRKLHDRLNRAIHLVQQLLTLARQGAISGYVGYENIRLQDLAKQVVSDFAFLAEEKNIDIGVDAPEQDVLITGNRESLRIMLGNIVDNAIRYTPAGGKVDVTVSKHPDGAGLSVADSGCGVPAEDRQRVFDRFYRREGTRESGSGLGLAIVRDVLDQHKASFSLGDTPWGQGLVFDIRFAASV
ncbi:ATP-binding protein [Undibacterium terreum]|uniref:histidine kinase n=1 Tax=Undibacterium terreum TaxID=1224302 RepID=A0A916UAH6_9BURK|nr:ATP-binding protein [Undibacterium terreum]GGC65881.1 two-component sensor histidine kinase [Undibacterium terreum]